MVAWWYSWALWLCLCSADDIWRSYALLLAHGCGDTRLCMREGQMQEEGKEWCREKGEECRKTESRREEERRPEQTDLLRKEKKRNMNNF